MESVLVHVSDLSDLFIPLEDCQKRHIRLMKLTHFSQALRKPIFSLWALDPIYLTHPLPTQSDSTLNVSKQPTTKAPIFKPPQQLLSQSIHPQHLNQPTETPTNLHSLPYHYLTINTYQAAQAALETDRRYSTRASVLRPSSLLIASHLGSSLKSLIAFTYCNLLDKVKRW